MAEKQRMTPEKVVRWLMESDGLNPGRESLRWMAEQLMEVEVSELMGAECGERTADRATHRNGYPKALGHRAGELELAIRSLPGASTAEELTVADADHGGHDRRVRSVATLVTSLRAVRQDGI